MNIYRVKLFTCLSLEVKTRWRTPAKTVANKEERDFGLGRVKILNATPVAVQFVLADLAVVCLTRSLIKHDI